MRPMTRQDHIDPQINKVQKCSTPGDHHDTVVIFTNGEWICSSAHVSDYGQVPNLRTSELDPVEWVKENAQKLAFNIPTELCRDHDANHAYSWGQDGHLWEDERLKLCLPKTRP